MKTFRTYIQHILNLSLGKPSKKINHEYRELVPTFFSPLPPTLVGKLIVGTVDQIGDPPPPSCGRENIVRRGEDKFNFPTVKRDNVDIQIPNWHQNSMFFPDTGQIPYLGLDLINPNSSFSYFLPTAS